MVEDRYGLSVDGLVSAAPWMFALLAEMSLSDRQEKLKVARLHVARLREDLPSHLLQASELFAEANLRLDAEEASVVADDVFGKMLPFVEEWPEVRDCPFTAFLAQQAKNLKRPTLDSAELETQLIDPLPVWSVHSAWLNELSGGDPVAAHALRAGLARVSDIPDQLREDARGGERITFLRKFVPTEERKQIEHNQSNQIIGDKR
jgi:hypothetical protein